MVRQVSSLRDLEAVGRLPSTHVLGFKMPALRDFLQFSALDLDLIHSYLNATMGSTLAARRAGK